jgi:hypothetical protein
MKQVRPREGNRNVEPNQRLRLLPEPRRSKRLSRVIREEDYQWLDSTPIVREGVILDHNPTHKMRCLGPRTSCVVFALKDQK